MLEGGRWWNQAFESIGYKDAFQVKLLPDTADPLDVRYNVIQWVHRSTRGWSYGMAITDPRTGEIIKGHVSLGSLRIRQDYLIAKAISNKPYASGNSHEQDMLNMAIARIRQLSAHEIGHTLGFQHNFAASVNDKASVMDYPHPTFTLVDGEISFADAYATGIGAWDKIATAFAYGDGNHDERSAQLNAALSAGYKNMNDDDARSPGSANIHAHLWDNGANTVDELERIMAVRRVALAQFSIDNIPNGEPVNTLEDLFVPIYLLHRYQVEAAVKTIGGLDYHYAVKGDGGTDPTVVEHTEQLRALRAVLNTLSPAELAIPKEKLNLFPPRATWTRTRENFKGKTNVAFDPVSAANMNAANTLRLLLHPARVTRLHQQHAIDPDLLSLNETLHELVDATLNTAPTNDPYMDAIAAGRNAIVLEKLMMLAQTDGLLPQVKAIVEGFLHAHKNELEERKRRTVQDEAYLRMITDYFAAPDAYQPQPIPALPDGSPIGSECRWYTVPAH